VYIDVLMGGGWLNSSGATGDVTNLQWFTGGTPGPGTSATYKPGNTQGGAGGGYGGIAEIPIVAGGRYSQAPGVTARGGSGSGLLTASRIDSAGALKTILVFVPGSGYTSAGLPSFDIDTTYELSPALLGTPTLMSGINPDGQYPLPSFAPPNVSVDALNNVYTVLERDMVHPSCVGVAYLSRRLAENIFQAVMAL
jgi:hypothetical protein